VHTFLEIEPDRALFERQIKCLVATCYQYERPLQGLAGLLDWHFQGQFSACLKAGAFTGKAGECVYLPVTKNAQTYHIMLVGLGVSNDSPQKAPPSPETMKLLHKNLLSLKLDKIGISRSDFGNPDDGFFTKQLKGIPLCIVP
jgi:hypothetical protein